MLSELSSIHDIDRAEWNELVDQHGGTIFHRHEWLAAYEKFYPHQAVKSVHHLVGRSASGGLIGLLPLFHTQNCPYWLSMSEEIKTTTGDFFSRPYLASHSWYAFYSDVIGDRSTEEYKNYIGCAVRRIDTICEQQNIPYSCFTAIKQTDQLTQFLQNEGYRAFNIMNNTALDLQTNSYAEYVRNLPPPHDNRHDIKKHIRRYGQRLVAVGIEKSWFANPSQKQIEKFHQLLTETYRRHAGTDLTDPLETLTALFNGMVESAGLVVLHKGDEWVAAALCFSHNYVFVAGYAGMLMTDELKPLNLRLNLYCACIERAFQLKCTHMEFGRTCYDYKAKLGIQKCLTQTLVKAYGNSAGEIYSFFDGLRERA